MSGFNQLLLGGGLKQSIVDDINSNKDTVQRITDYVQKGQGKHQAYERLANFTDFWGPRISGSKVLEDSITDMMNILRSENLDNVDGEPVKVPDWRRGTEWATMVSPREQDFEILALGSSVGTQNETGGTLEAEIIVVTSFEELESMNDADVLGKIVVFNQGWDGYGHGKPYRDLGASAAAKKGAAAALIQSVADFTLYTPHTGQQVYQDNTAQIPVACITIEDAEFLNRMSHRGPVKLQLHMEAVTYPEKDSYNIIAEIIGSEYPDQVVVIGAHIDSWDVGMGVMDDGGGVFITLQAMTILKRLGLTPKRTLRLVLWTAEEEGLIGAKAYFEAHKNESDNFVIVMESDGGTFTPRGIGFSGTDDARMMIEAVMKLLSDFTQGTGVGESGSSPDTGEWEAIGVPVGNLWNANENYFYYHHTHADSMTMMDADVLDLCTIVWTSAAYVFANTDQRIPREGESIGGTTALVPNCISITLAFCLMILLKSRHDL
ncbi:hypothetical protein CAPTEDRAFT_217179 [Capitella teleta]|uniref:Carboxypeptidase Q n=1 Tax=Capitella teleta TaxID=283909 RepID=R7TTN8_CAPTE|nr:hypothetical protein CAPTEDRAFT_217179 [Capitella teleta]|eukprot:ELT96982.1 hypothetical protein CAPTEDRAFT_217179 [Capitella teleta]